ncbi:MAG: hypothetical protein A2143_02250 [Gallionellales bacterium RBG_16_57_15]|nr:MAG: hypothetical protein A2143_02250 [Gallionellales bacterium RBG_16_57_15]
MMRSMSSKYIRAAVDLCGNQPNLVRRIMAKHPHLKIMPSYLFAWMKANRADRPPAEYVLPIAEAVDWQITPHQLRTDLYPHQCDGMPKPGHIINECVVMRTMPIVNELHIHDSEHVGLVSGVVEHTTPLEDFNAAQIMSARMDAMSSALGVQIAVDVVEQYTPSENYNAAQIVSARIDAVYITDDAPPHDHQPTKD